MGMNSWRQGLLGLLLGAGLLLVHLGSPGNAALTFK